MRKMIVRKLITMSPVYLEKIRKIREEVGLSSDSEVIRRAIDVYAKEMGVLEKT